MNNDALASHIGYVNPKIQDDKRLHAVQLPTRLDESHVVLRILEKRWTSARDTFTPSPLASSIMASGVNMGMSSMRVKACTAKTFSRSV